jgi:hypothetical protein
MKFIKQNYNEFNDGVRWHDYFAFIINEFPVVLIRKYDWPHGRNDRYTFMVQVFGFKVYQYIGVEE